MALPQASADADPIARKTWRTLEPLHGLVYFAPEATAAYSALGLGAEQGYFVSRSAPMGAVGAATVVATFFNFEPGLVHRCLDGAWDIAAPDAMVAARLAVADDALRRMLGDAVHSGEMDRAAELARAAAEVACRRPQGRTLFAGHAALDWPGPSHLVLWHAQTLLREFRGDGHIAALLVQDAGSGRGLGAPCCLRRGGRGLPPGHPRLARRRLASGRRPAGRSGLAEPTR